MSELRILIIGSDQKWSIERFYLKHLREANVSVELFSAQDIFYKYYNRSIFHKILFRTGLSSVLSAINRQVISAVSDFNPHIVWVFKGMEIFSDTLSTLKQAGIKVVCYNPDNPFLFTGKGSGNANVTKSIPLYDLHFTYSLEIESQLKAQFNAKTSYLPFGFEISDELYENTSREKEIIKCCFLGNPDKERGKFIKQLADTGIQIDLFGNFWDQYLSHKNLTIHAPVYGNDFYKILFAYRVQLNVMRVHNLRSHNMRSFEIPGIGGIQLAPDTPEHRLFFNVGSEIFIYDSVESCAAQVQKLLAFPVSEANAVRRQSRARCVGSGYSYRHRSQHALDAMNALMNG